MSEGGVDMVKIVINRTQLSKVIPYEEVDSEPTALQPKVGREGLTKIKIKQQSPLPEPNGTQTLIKINVKKTANGTVTNYKSSILNQKPIKVGSRPPVVLPRELELESFREEGHTYFVHWGTGYIFPPNTYEATDHRGLAHPNPSAKSPIRRSI